MFDRNKLKQHMEDTGTSTAEMSRILGVTEGFVRHILTGIKQPSLAMTVEISKKMGCTVDDLIASE